MTDDGWETMEIAVTEAVPVVGASSHKSATWVTRSITLGLLTLAVACGRADRVSPNLHRPDASPIIANARKIGTPNGVERLEKVRIGGIEQWVSIRGTDKRNPVLLVIHGGPGYVLMPMSWWSSRDWEEYFTVVQWDQRGSGKTYLLNDPNNGSASSPPSLSATPPVLKNAVPD
jgi:hypothetical protein